VGKAVMKKIIFCIVMCLLTGSAYTCGVYGAQNVVGYSDYNMAQVAYAAPAQIATILPHKNFVQQRQHVQVEQIYTRAPQNVIVQRVVQRLQKRGNVQQKIVNRSVQKRQVQQKQFVRQRNIGVNY
jgi:hypothetical protein